MKNILLIFIVSLFFGCGEGNVNDFIIENNDTNSSTENNDSSTIIEDENNSLETPPTIPEEDTE